MSLTPQLSQKWNVLLLRRRPLNKASGEVENPTKIRILRRLVAARQLE
jgi:ribosomal protein L29